MPFINDKFPKGHRFFQDGDLKHSSHSTKRYMSLHAINTFPMQADSSHLNPIEMVWNDLK